MCSGLVVLFGHITSLWIWSHLFFDIQEFCKIIPADQNLFYFLEPSLIYSLKKFSVILWNQD